MDSNQCSKRLFLRFDAKHSLCSSAQNVLFHRIVTVQFVNNLLILCRRRPDQIIVVLRIESLRREKWMIGSKHNALITDQRYRVHQRIAFKRNAVEIQIVSGRYIVDGRFLEFPLFQ